MESVWCNNKMSSAAGGIDGLKAGLLSIGAALLLLGITVKLMGSMSPDEIAQGFKGLVAVVMSVVAVFLAFGVMTRLGGTSEHINDAGKMLMKLSIALLIMVAVAKIINTMTWGEMGKAAVAIGGFISIVALLMTITLIPGRNVHRIGSMLLKISTAMMLMVGVVKLMNTITWSEMGKAAIGIAGFIGIVALLMTISLIPGHNVDKVGGMLLKISAAFIILIFTVKLISGMSKYDMGKGIAGILALTGVVALLVAITRIAGNDTPKIAGTLLALSLSIGILAGVAMMLSLLKVEGLVKGIAAIGVLSIFMMGMIYATKGAENCKENIMMMAIAIGVMTASVAVLSLIDGKKLAGAVLALSVLMGMFALIEKMGSNMQRCIGNLIVMTVAIGLLSAALFVLSKIPIESSLATAASLSMLLLSFSVAMGILGRMTTVSPLALVAVGVLTVVVGALAGILYLLRDLPVESTLNNAISLSTLILSLSVACGILALVGLGGPAALIGILSLAALIVGIGALVVGIGALADKYPQMEEFLDKGIPIIEKIGHALGSFFGNIASGFMTAAGSALPTLAGYLSEFMTNLQPFIAGANNIDANILIKIGALSGAIILLTAAEVIAAIGSFVTGGASFAKLGADLSMFMINATPFLTRIKMVDPNSLTAVKALAEAILILTAANVIEGLTSWFTGGNSLASFGSQLGEFGKNFNDFVTNLGTFDDSKLTTVKCACEAIKLLAEASNALPGENGMIQKILGEQSIASFGSKLGQLALDLNTFVANLGTFNVVQETTVKCAANAIKVLAEAAESLPGENGMIQKILGEQSIASFGRQLGGLGTDLNTFVTNLGTFSDAQVATVGCAASAITKMAKAAESIDGQADWAKKLFGDNSISAFSGNLPTLGTNLKSFVTNLGTFDNSKVVTVNAAVRTINAISKLSDTDMKKAKKNLPAFGDSLTEFASDISDFCNDMPSTSTLNTVSTNVSKIISMIEEMSNSNSGPLAEFANNLKSIGAEAVGAFVSAFTSKAAQSDVKAAGENLIANVIDGVKNKKDKFKTSVKDMVSAGVDAAKKKRKDFYNAGSHLVSGFASGISENTYKATAKAKAMAAAAEQAAKDELDINSPSKVFRKIGSSVPEGFAMGIEMYGRLIKGSTSTMANTAIDSFKDSISRISDVVNSDIESQPTIRPVLDLSGVNSGIGTMNGMFNLNPSVGVMANLNAISSNMSISQNGSNNDIVSAINDLKKSLNNRPGDTINVNGITYDDGSNVADAIRTITRAVRMERRV